MNECSQYKYLQNNKLKDAAKFRVENFRVGLSLYEVIRIIDTKAIFVEQHLLRLVNSAKQVGQYIWLDRDELIEKINLVIKKNGVSEGNIKIVFNIHDNNRNFYCYFVHHKYPTTQEYKNGVRTVIYNAERSKPKAKVYNHKLRTYTNTIIEDPEIFEVILMDNLNNITEGSRSNLFLIKGEQLVTSPDDEVLNGIVRTKVIEICEKMGIPVLKEKIAYKTLSDFDSAFLTGTSRQILPVREMDSISFKVDHHLLKQLLEAYRKEVRDYLDHDL